MISTTRPFALLCATLFAAAASYAADKKGDDDARWVKGPAKADLKGVAEIQVTTGQRFADAAFTQELIRAAGNPVSGNEAGLLINEKDDWSVIFRFADIGYVKDDDKDKLDADKLLQSYKDGTEAANEVRRKNGAPPLTVLGWEKKPAYDEATHNLEWALRAESRGRQILNYNVRLLGRKGVMEVILIVEPERLEKTLPDFRTLITGFAYKQGERYAEYKQGDKVAKYGLAALVLGGSAAIAAKLGFFGWIAVMFKKVWKLVVVVVVAIGAGIKRLIFGKERVSTEEPPPVNR
jgi:uncharacterized membrane-anchored protein